MWAYDKPTAGHGSFAGQKAVHPLPRRRAPPSNRIKICCEDKNGHPLWVVMSPSAARSRLMRAHGANASPQHRALIGTNRDPALEGGMRGRPAPALCPTRRSPDQPGCGASQSGLHDVKRRGASPKRNYTPASHPSGGCEYRGLNAFAPCAHESRPSSIQRLTTRAPQWACRTPT